MNPEIKAKWVEALRSGEYEQGENSLLHGGRYCCLGVLASLATAAGVCSVRGYGYSVLFDGYSAFLPESVASWAGLPSTDPEVSVACDDTDPEDWPLTLTGANDLGMTFAEIADIIEEEL